MAAPATSASSIPSASISSSTFPTEEANSRPTYSSKLGGAKGKLENITPTTAQRQVPTQKAWVSGTNPITQRLSNPSHRNGTTTRTQTNPTGSSSALLREGLRIRITLDSGAEYEGTYSTGSDSTYTLKMVTQKKQASSGEMSNGTTKQSRDQASMSFQKKDVADIHVTGAALPARNVRQNGSSSFRTDTAISGNKFQGERTLQPWVPDDDVDTTLSSGLSGNINTDDAGWDQFAVNEKLFGVTTSYDENIYTTVIDKNHPDYSKRYADAERKAREIEKSAAYNSHVAEERVKDNLTATEGGDEEDKYSGVQRQDFPPLAPSGRPEKYMPPGRRVNVQQSAISNNGNPGGIHSDPAIISSSLARKASPAAEKENKIPLPPKPATSQAAESDSTLLTANTTTESKATTTSEMKPAPANSSASGSRTASPQSRAGVTPNATATVEQDVFSAFKGFAAQQRSQADKLRVNKAKADKADKLSELKKFAANFKLDSPVPSDLVSIIAKDPAKQREIQDRARRNAEIAEQTKFSKASVAETGKAASPNLDPKAPLRPVAIPSQTPPSASGAPSRQNQTRAPNFPPQGPYTGLPMRGDRPGQGQPGSGQRQVQGNLGQRLRSLEQSKNGQLPPQMLSNSDSRQPPTGPAHGIDQNFSRRSSGTTNMMGPKLNPNSFEFKPSAQTFNPNSKGSTGSSPRSNSAAPPNTSTPAPSGTLFRRRPAPTHGESVSECTYNIIETIASIQPPPGQDKKWESTNGGFKPAFDTIPTWRQPANDEPEGSTMHLTYVKLFENSLYANQTLSPPPPSHVHPQAPHQHQLPFHLQNNISQRQSPRQPPMHLHNNQHGHGPNPPFSPDEHRMMPSHSAQSYASPRLGAVNMAYPSPMGQSAQLAYNQPGMQYPMGPGGPQVNYNRSYSGGHQFIPQQATHMAGPVMMPGPGGNGFMSQGGMIQPAPQMIYPGGQPHFVPPGNGPPPMSGTNGYPSPGRTAPMMMNQGSQQGQSVYGMSPGIQYGQPIYAQQQQGQMPNMRYGNQSQQQFGTSPQMHQYGPPHRGPNGGYNNKNFQQPQHGPHSSVQQSPIPTGPQARAPDVVDEAK